MLEGQVAVLSSGAIVPDQAVSILEALFESNIYRHDQKSFMLYPDRKLPGFLDKNRIPVAQIEEIPLLEKMLALVMDLFCCATQMVTTVLTLNSPISGTWTRSSTC